MAKSSPCLVSIFQEKYDHFLLHFGLFLVKKGAWSRVKGSQSKFHIPYFRKFFPVPDDGEKLGGPFKKEKSSPYHLWNSSESKNKKNVISLYIRKIRSFPSSFSSHFLQSSLILGHHELRLILVFSKMSQQQV